MAKDLNDRVAAGEAVQLGSEIIDLDKYRDTPAGHADRALELELFSAIVNGRVDALGLGLQPLAFSLAAHVDFARLLNTLGAEGLEIDRHVVATEIENRAGGKRGALLGVLRKVLEAPPVTAPKSAMDRIGDLAETRRVHSVLQRAVDAASRGDLVQARALAISVGESDTHRTVIEHIAESVGIVVLEAMAKKASSLVPTGIRAVDSIITGVPAGSLTVIGAATGVGKTAAALSLCLSAAKSGWHAGYISCEDPRDVIGGRVLSFESGVPGALIRSGRIGYARKELEDACVRIASMGVHVAYELGATDISVIQSMTALVRNNGARVIVVDYAQCITAADSQGDTTRDISRIASRLKAAGQRLGVPVVLNSQLSRPKDGEQFKRPHIHKLKESGDMENSADLVLLLWRQSPDDHAPVNGYIAKSKWGGGGADWVMRRRDGLLIEEG